LIRSLAVALLLAGAATPPFAQDDPLAPLPTETEDQAPPEPDVQPLQPVTPAQPVTRPVVVPKDWRGVFAAIRAGDWASAQAGINSLPDDLLKPVARAELYTARNSPRVELQAVLNLLGEAPDLPKAGQLLRIALARGAAEAELPAVPAARRMVPLASAPRRHRARPVAGDAAADALRLALEPLVKADAAEQAEALYLQAAPTLSPEGRAEAAQRVAWIYYVLGRDVDARRVAETATEGGAGEWVGHANWIAGLASWRLDDCNAAARHFRAVASDRVESELLAAGAYWAARAEQACRRPQAVAPLLKAAARSNESFYGLIARETLGVDTRMPADFSAPSSEVDNIPNVRRAVALVKIGERWLAEDFLRHQARVGQPHEHHGLIDTAKRLDLAGAQFWLAHNGQAGATAHPQDRYPTPRWAPITGWRVDPALAFAHIIQESTFRSDAVSPADAVGLMQVRPGTAQDMARARNLPYSRASLTDPSYNLEFGQSFIELMRRSSSTGGQLPRMVAAYNAGPVPVGRWAAIPGQGDPLLWIESIPYWETRFYVPAVFRNMWVYQGLGKAEAPTLSAMAQHRWPAFPARRSNPAR